MNDQRTIKHVKVTMKEDCHIINIKYLRPDESEDSPKFRNTENAEYHGTRALVSALAALSDWVSEFSDIDLEWNCLVLSVAWKEDNHGLMWIDLAGYHPGNIAKTEFKLTKILLPRTPPRFQAAIDVVAGAAFQMVDFDIEARAQQMGLVFPDDSDEEDDTGLDVYEKAFETASEHDGKEEPEPAMV